MAHVAVYAVYRAAHDSLGGSRAETEESKREDPEKNDVAGRVWRVQREEKTRRVWPFVRHSV